MMKKSYFRISLIILLAVQILAFMPMAAQAAYSIKFANHNIQITSPAKNGQSFDGRVEIEGTSSLDTVYFCVRGPQNNVYVTPVDVKKGSFNGEVLLRLGPGKYTIWAGDNAQKFDGSIRFEVVNESRKDNRYLDPSAYVDSENEDIVALAETLADSAATETEKLAAVHDWLVKNIDYDVDAYNAKSRELKSASQTLADGEGLCRDYAFLTCALFRAMDMPARVIYGEAVGFNGRQSHAWNEVLVNGKWLVLDTTWDAGYIKNGKFVPSPSKKYLNPAQDLLAKTHQSSQITLY